MRETFQMFAVAWDIDRAKQIVSDGRAPNFHVSVVELVRTYLGTQAHEFDDTRFIGMIGINRAHVMSAYVDTQQPLIAVRVPHPTNPDARDSLLIIDGWHRVAKAYRTHICLCASETCGVRELPVHVLTAQEERRIHLRGPALRRRARRTRKENA